MTPLLFHQIQNRVKGRLQPQMTLGSSQQVCGARAKTILDGWGQSRSWNLRFGFRIYSPSLCDELVVQIIQRFLVFNRPNHIIADAKYFRCWSWSRSQKF